MRYINHKDEGNTSPFSHGVLTSFSQLLVTAGQVSMDEEGEVVGAGDIEVQSVQVMENLKRLLEKSEMGFSDVIKFNMYLVNLDHLPKVLEIRNKYLDSSKPASTTVEVSGLAKPEFLLEIELMAVK